MTSTAARPSDSAPQSSRQPGFTLQEDLWFGDFDDEGARGTAARSLSAMGGRIMGARPIPQAAQKLVQLTRNEDADVRQVVRVLEMDPGLSQKILRLVNSAGYGLRIRCTSLGHATALLGQTKLRQVATSAVLFDHFGKPSPLTRKKQEHGALVASLSRYLAIHLGLPQDDLFTIGLLHDIGQLMMLDDDLAGYADLLSGVGDEFDQLHVHERALLGFDHAVLAGHVLASWSIPAPVPEVIALHHQPARAHQSGLNVAAMVQTLRFADHLGHCLELKNPKAAIVELAESEAASYLDFSEIQIAAMWRDLEKVRDVTRNRRLNIIDVAPRTVEVPASLRPRSIPFSPQAKGDLGASLRPPESRAAPAPASARADDADGVQRISIPAYVSPQILLTVRASDVVVVPSDIANEDAFTSAPRRQHDMPATPQASDDDFFFAGTENQRATPESARNIAAKPARAPDNDDFFFPAGDGQVASHNAQSAKSVKSQAATDDEDFFFSPAPSQSSEPARAQAAAAKPGPAPDNDDFFFSPAPSQAKEPAKAPRAAAQPSPAPDNDDFFFPAGDAQAASQKALSAKPTIREAAPEDDDFFFSPAPSQAKEPARAQAAAAKPGPAPDNDDFFFPAGDGQVASQKALSAKPARSHEPEPELDNFFPSSPGDYATPAELGPNKSTHSATDPAPNHTSKGEWNQGTQADGLSRLSEAKSARVAPKTHATRPETGPEQPWFERASKDDVSPEVFPCAFCYAPTFGATCQVCSAQVCAQHQFEGRQWCVACEAEFQDFSRKNPLPPIIPLSFATTITVGSLATGYFHSLDGALGVVSIGVVFGFVGYVWHHARTKRAFRHARRHAVEAEELDRSEEATSRAESATTEDPTSETFEAIARENEESEQALKPTHEEGPLSMPVPRTRSDAFQMEPICEPPRPSLMNFHRPDEDSPRLDSLFAPSMRAPAAAPRPVQPAPQEEPAYFQDIFEGDAPVTTCSPSAESPFLSIPEEAPADPYKTRATEPAQGPPPGSEVFPEPNATIAPLRASLRTLPPTVGFDLEEAAAPAQPPSNRPPEGTLDAPSGCREEIGYLAPVCQAVQSGSRIEVRSLRVSRTYCTGYPSGRVAIVGRVEA